MGTSQPETFIRRQLGGELGRLRERGSHRPAAGGSPHLWAQPGSGRVQRDPDRPHGQLFCRASKEMTVFCSRRGFALRPREESGRCVLPCRLSSSRTRRFPRPERGAEWGPGGRLRKDGAGCAGLPMPVRALPGGGELTARLRSKPRLFRTAQCGSGCIGGSGRWQSPDIDRWSHG